jgi:3-phytase
VHRAREHALRPRRLQRAGALLNRSRRIDDVVGDHADASGDVADDPAIWRDPEHPDRSLVLVDDKSRGGGGVAVFDVHGGLRHYERNGVIGNIDQRTDYRLGDRSVVLVAANDRSGDVLRFWELDTAGGKLAPLEAKKIHTVAPNYGFCLGRSADGKHTYAIVSQEEGGTLEQYELQPRDGKIDARKVRTLTVESQTEGCTVDDTTGTLYQLT